MGYLDLLRGRHVLRLLVGTLVGRLPSAMAPLAIPLALRQSGATYTVIGLAVGTFAVAAAVGGPVLGRLVDRVGQVRILAPAAVLAGIGLIAIAVAPSSPAIVFTGAVLAGAATPPLEPCLRALWPDVVPPGRLESAYALDSASQELVFIGGPLLVGACLAFASPMGALWLAALVGGLGVLVVATAPPTRAWRAPARSADWLGPLTSPGLRVLLVSLTGVGVALGTLNVLVIAYAERQQVPGGAALMLALNAGGALIGGLGYGAIRWSSSPRRRLVLLTAGLACSYALLCLVPSPPYMAVVMVVTGLFLAPVLSASFVLVGDLAPAGTVTEAFAWLVTLMTVGVALGSTAVGAVLEQSTQSWAAACGVLGTAIGLLILLTGRHHLSPTPTPASTPSSTST
ncbi:MFS transporter [Sphaerisporangium melleum]|uniref:MFS transporter n=1 Tax=Sphaerisporangium melleum TaxID=321316 RepID=A0A917QRB5_9ACTN|nr:MFS transporter [Sphaerisporangium melleum]GGK65270.1 MFS transporter [Sphaerisporangium melleum]GII69979.1 MFS transporter [Sphaerisporangium melleum]